MAPPGDERIWTYPARARRVAGHHEMPGSRGSERVVIIVDRDVTPFISARDPAAAFCNIRHELDVTAQRLFDQGHVTKVTDEKGPQHWHWQIAISKADLEETAETEGSPGLHLRIVK